MLKEKRWYKRSYRRNLIDMHIDDWNEAFLSEFSPEDYVRLLKTAQVQSAMVYANSHVGHCYWPSKAGHMHAGLKGRDIFGSINELCRREGMDFIAYYSLIYNNWAYEQDTSWRMVDSKGKSSREAREGSIAGGRYGICCPNTGYRDFVLSQIDELCGRYDFDGVFFDMTFWPVVCCCPSCKERFRNETGEYMPMTVDWDDPLWNKFQKKREDWMAEFARITTEAVKSRKPQCTVLHNSTPPAALSWSFGAADGVLEACDYLGGDFYNNFLHQSFICKYFYATSKNLPFEYYTSRCDPDLNDDHVSMKHADILKINNYLSLAHCGAFLFIDAIDPVGTLNPAVYEAMGAIFEESKAYERHLGGKLAADAAIYYSLDSKMDLFEKGKSSSVISSGIPHLDAALGAAGKLLRDHLAFSVAGKGNLDMLQDFQAIILPDASRITDEEAEALRRFVENGGGLYISGHAPSGLVRELLGITGLGWTEENTTFMAPTREGLDWMPGVSAKYPLTVNLRQMLVKTEKPAEVLATMTLPYTNPRDYSVFSSIHSNPPGRRTSFPSILHGTYGKGRVVWAAAPFESMKRLPHERVFTAIIEKLLPAGRTMEADAPAAVEILLFHQQEKNRFILNVVNEQEQVPVIPVKEIKIRIRTGNKKVRRVCILPPETDIPYLCREGFTEIYLSDLDIFRMISVEYEV